MYRGAASGGFALAPAQIVSDGMQRGVLVDFNSDDSIDLIMVGRRANVLEIHANNGIGRLGLGDRIAPDLQLVDGTTITVPAGVEFVDPGATAIDDIDGDITDKIEVSGTVDTAIAGTYRLTYSVTDRASNNSTVVRTVNVGPNAGTGGGGGGAISPLFLLILMLLPIALRRALRTP